MSLRQRYLNILTGIIPAGLVGASLLLGSATPVAANRETAGGAAAAARVSERLAAVREAVSDVAGPGAKAEPQLAWWGNVGWGRPGWRNGGWRNVGWRNGGWRNGGWHNGWNNFWRNW